MDPAYAELWFALGRRDWKLVALVPADPDRDATADAWALAHIGKQVNDITVTVFAMEKIVTAPVLAHVTEQRPDTSSGLTYASATQLVAAATAAQAAMPTGKVIVAVQPVIAEPLGVSVTNAAECVVLCVELGHTPLAALRRTIELVGRERIAGCFLKGPA